MSVWMEPRNFYPVPSIGISDDGASLHMEEQNRRVLFGSKANQFLLLAHADCLISPQ